MFDKLINEIKINSNSKKKYFLKNLKKNEINLIIKMIKLNLIKFIIKFNKKYIIYLNLFKKNKTVFKIKCIHTRSKLKNIKYKNLKKINYSNKLLLINTNKNVLTNFESEKNKIGGVIILYLWN